MVKLRKILFALFTVLYLIVCPTLILYSLGIVIKPGKENIIKTGVIYISSIPPGASVSLNGTPLNEETPALIDNLLPGNYTLTLKAANYQAWTTTASVSSEKATPLENILLLPDPVKTNELSEEPVNKLIPVEDNPFLIVTTGPNAKDIFVHIWDEGITQNILPERPGKTPRLKPLFPEGTNQYKGRVLRIFSVDGNSHLIFEIENNGEKKFLWTDPLFGESKTEDITRLFPVQPDSIEWSKDDPRHLLSFQNNTINRIDIATKAVYPRIAEKVKAFTQYEEKLFILSDVNTLTRANIDNVRETARPVSSNPLFNELVLRNAPFLRMTAVSHNIILLLGKGGQLISNLKPYLLAEGGIVGFKWNTKPRQILLWSRDKIGFIDFSKNMLETNPPSITWVQEKARDITNAFWVNEGSHILFTDSDQMFIAAVNCCGMSDIKKLRDIRRQSDIYYSDRTGKVFFIDKGTARLSSMEIIPQHALLPTVRRDKSIKEERE